MSTSIKDIEEDNITTTNCLDSMHFTNKVVDSFLYNQNNKKKIIGLNTELVQKMGRQSKTALLVLCDGESCLIFQLPREEWVKFPASLFNFLNLPDFTFVGIGINKMVMKLESEFGLTCKNVVEVGSSTWDLGKMMADRRDRFMEIVSGRREKPKDAVLSEWDATVLDKDQIELATWNAHFAFLIANILLGD